MTLIEDLELMFKDYILPIFLFFFLAYILYRLSDPIVSRFMPLGDLVALRHNPRRYERQKTLRALASSAMSVAGFIVAGLASLSLFISLDTLIWVVGLFSAAFGLGVRPFISDYITGLSFMFEDTFDVGEKIEIPASPQTVEGVVESVTLRITRIRGMDGELFTMPNGDIRLIRNFSRGEFSPTNVTLRVPSKDLPKILDHLEALGEEAMTLLPNLIEPWKVISMSGELADMTELTVLAKAKFGKGAVLRTRMLALIQEHISTLDLHGEIEDMP